MFSQVLGQRENELTNTRFDTNDKSVAVITKSEYDFIPNQLRKKEINTNSQLLLPNEITFHKLVRGRLLRGELTIVEMKLSDCVNAHAKRLEKILAKRPGKTTTVLEDLVIPARYLQTVPSGT